VKMSVSKAYASTDVSLRMKFISAISIFLLLTPPIWASEEEAEVPDNQDFMEHLIKQSGMTPEQIKESGVTPEMMQQINQMMNSSGVMQIGVMAQEAEEAEKKAEFEAATAGFGTARVSFKDQQYDLKLLQCKYFDDKGSFTISAQESWRALVDATLGINSQVGSNSSITFTIDDQEYFTYVKGFDFDGQNLAWDGTVRNSPEGDAHLSITLTCRE